MKKICQTCGEEFNVRPSRVGKYCSRQCKDQAQRKEKVKRICVFCKKSFEIFPSALKKGEGTFCSKKCYGLSIKGKPLSVECREALNKVTMLKGPESIGWRGGRVRTAKGYILVYAPDHPNRISGAYVREHRLVMEKILGRFLSPTEVVHHINGIKDANESENLKLFESTGEHSRMHLILA